MAENEDEKPHTYEDDEEQSGIFRWMSLAVVLLAVAGFLGLAWYAYKSGSEAVDEKDVELVKADNTPVKETPANPGGMQIPNQDKTVYGLVGGKTEKLPVERILPAPEEPLPHGADTQTWMSDKVKSKVDNEAGTEKNEEMVPPAAISGASEPHNSGAAEPKKTEQYNPAKIRAEKEALKDSAKVDAGAKPAPIKPEVKPQPTPAKPVAVVPTPPAAFVTHKPEVKKQEIASQLPEKKPEVAAASKKPDAALPKGARIQLGAYKSEDEAKENWNRIAKKFADEVKSRDHFIVRADVKDKGVYYRLQVGPFASPKDGEEFCLTFVSQGQGCFLAKAK